MITIEVPKKRLRTGKAGSYISPATQSLSIAITPKSGGTTVVNETIDLTPTSPGCKSTPSGTVCSILSVAAAPGPYVATVSAYSGLGGSGSVLSQAQNEPFSIVAGVQNQILLTLYGVPKTYSVVSTLPPLRVHSGQASRSVLEASGPRRNHLRFQ